MKLKIATLFSILFFGLVSASFAAPWKSDNPNIVNRFTSDNIYIVGEETNPHSGEDLVMKAGKGPVVHQWFEGEGNEGTVGHHSVWRAIKGDACPTNWIPVPDAHAYDGGLEYFEEGVLYCVKTNDYNPSYYLKNN